MMDRSVFKLIRDDEINDSFRISVEFGENDFNITIFKKSNAWAAKVEHEEICFQAKHLEVNADEYFKKIQEYIRSSSKNVILKFNNNEFTINCILDNNIKVIYFSYRLEKVNYSESVEILMEKFYTERNQSLEKFVTIYKEKNELETSRNQFQLKLNEFIERKKTDDEELFSNFVLVLNEKKKRIQHLTELLEAFRRGRSSVNLPVKVKKRSKKLEPIEQVESNKKEMISESDSEENYDTDEEKSKRPRDLSDKPCGEEVNQNKNDIYAVPSTSRFDFFCDDSPPRHLPKRIKGEVNDGNNICIKPSTSKLASSKNEIDKLDYKATDDNTPNINFSTQELLDNI